MKANLKCGLLLSVLAIAGCGGGPTLDATSEQTYAASTKAMTASMSDNQKRQFATDVMAALGSEGAKVAMKNTFSKDKTATSPTEMYKPLQGMTVDQIQAKADENRAKLKKK